MNAKTPILAHSKRLVIKTGSALVTDETTGKSRKAWMASLMEDIAHMRARGTEVVLVSSGGVALGRKILGFEPGQSLKLPERQASAACGQVRLMDRWRDMANIYDMRIAQVLLTLDISEERDRYVNARNTLNKLLELDILPIVNENDTIAAEDLRVGDNDRLAARVAEMVEADTLIIFSNIDGFYTKDPTIYKDAKKIDLVEEFTPEIEAMAGKSKSSIATGGMITKLKAAKLAQHSGCHTLIANGTAPHPLEAALEPGVGTWFLGHPNPVQARKRWISGTLQTMGHVVVDAGAMKALGAGNSLLAVGITEVHGNFEKGDTVSIQNAKGDIIGRGLIEFDADELRQIIGKQSDDFEAILGYKSRHSVIHRDDMVMIHGR